MKRNYWPHAIIAYFVIFITGVATWVTFAMRHNDQLVRTDYYEHEIKYQNQIDRLARTAAGVAVIQYDRNIQAISVGLPTNINPQAVTGIIHLYRPSDARLDQKFPLQLKDSGSQLIDVSKLRTGFWKVSLNWKDLDREFYFEKSLVIDTR
ncbi:MAG: FixH family protein [Limisphaerales bacterium]